MHPSAKWLSNINNKETISETYLWLEGGFNISPQTDWEPVQPALFDSEQLPLVDTRSN